MLRRVSFVAPALALTIALGGCMATETLSINPFAKRSILQDAGAETASLSPVTGSSLGKRAVVRLAPDFTVAGVQLSPVYAESLPGWREPIVREPAERSPLLPPADAAGGASIVSP